VASAISRVCQKVGPKKKPSMEAGAYRTP
jgi:hypothetical protein